MGAWAYRPNKKGIIEMPGNANNTVYRDILQRGRREKVFDNDGDGYYVETKPFTKIVAGKDIRKASK